jgi:hypothetical protein
MQETDTSTFETLVNFCEAAEHRIPEDSNIQDD